MKKIEKMLKSENDDVALQNRILERIVITVKSVYFQAGAPLLFKHREK